MVVLNDHKQHRTKTSTFSQCADHRDPKAPNVRLDAVAFLVEVRIDPLGLEWKR